MMQARTHGVIFILVLLSGLVQAADYETHVESYLVPDHGELVLQVPAEWQISHTFWQDDRPPLITFYEYDEKKRDLFQLNVSVLWDDGFARNVTSPVSVKNLVEQVGNDILEYSREEELTLEKLAGKNGKGYYFSVSDAFAKPGEYQYLTQGALAVGEIVVIFSLFTHDRETSMKEKTLEMMRTAIQRHQRDVHWLQ